MDKYGNVREPVVAGEHLMGLNVQPVDLDNSARMSMIVGKGDAKKYRAAAFKLMRAAQKAEKNDPARAAKWRAEAQEMNRRAQQAESAGASKARDLRGEPANALTR